ncbi:MAG: ribonuclease III [Calditrichaeota bacterium]|nr:MAG: ribonuclease III [Calditrichota bacterium]
MIELIRKFFTSKELENLPTNYDKKLEKIQKEIGYKFKDKNLLVTSLKHGSFLQTSSEEKTFSYERLEFLGDAVLELIVSDFLYTNYPETLEGELTKMRSQIVSRKSLAKRGKEIDLANYVLMSENEEATGGRKRNSIVSNAYEALIGAIYIDGGKSKAEKFILRFVLENHKDTILDKSSINYKGKLLEYLQLNKICEPQYVVVQEEGPEHDKVFTLELIIDEKIYGIGTGRTKKIAEQKAACAGLEKLALEKTQN